MNTPRGVFIQMLKLHANSKPLEKSSLSYQSVFKKHTRVNKLYVKRKKQFP